MKSRYLIGLVAAMSFLIFGCAMYPGIKFTEMFSIPREPATSLSPGQHFDMQLPEGNKIIITDIYIENLGGGRSLFRVLEQRGENSFEVRYTFRTDSNQVTNINFSNGLRLGDERPIAGSIRIDNASDSQARILPRVNGFIVH